MASYIVCSCCEERVAATAADVGRAVVCPRSRRLVLVNEEELHTDDSGTGSRPGSRRRRVVVAIAALALLLPLAFFLSQEMTDEPAGPESPNSSGRVDIAEIRTSDTQTTSRDSSTAQPANPLVVVPGQPATTASTVGVVSPPSGSSAVVVVPPATQTIEAPVAPTAGNELATTNGASSPVTEHAATTGTTTGMDKHGLTIHRLARRIDMRTAEELQQELIKFREVALDTPAHPTTSNQLYDLGISRRSRAEAYPGPMIAAQKREDLAGIPFLLGVRTVLFQKQAEDLDALSKALRTSLQQCTVAPDPRPDPDKLFEALLSGEQGIFRNKKWATAAAVPCIQQMLQAQGEDIRRMSVELLRGIDDPAATEALVRWSVFDVAAANRAAAVDALKTRDRAAVTEQLLGWLRYPWARAAEHAAEALVALNCESAVPALVSQLSLPAPDAPQASSVAGETRSFRREVVRVNHLKNCLMCHPPSPASANDLVRGAIPDLSQPPPRASYYTGSSRSITAATTYLRQDCSVMLPVANPGLWPAHQRFDFLVATRPLRKDESVTSEAGNLYQAAILFALRELSRSDLGTTAANWESLRNGQASPDDRLFLEIARFLSLNKSPDPLILLSLTEFGEAFLSLSEAEQEIGLSRLRRTYGSANTRTALVAYLAGILRNGDASSRDKARVVLTRIMGKDFETDRIDAAVAATMLDDARAFVRVAGASALGSIGKDGKPHYKRLLGLLKDPDAEVRLAAATALGEVTAAYDDVYDGLAAVTQDGTDRVRLAAVKSLNHLKYLPRSTASPLARGLVSKQTWESAENRAAFEKLVADLLEEMKRNNGDGYGVILKAAAGETPSDVPAATLARLLSVMGPPNKDQLPALVQLLVKPEYRAVADAQLIAANDDAIPLLIAALQDDREKMRLVAAELLGRAACLNRKPAPAAVNWRAAADALATLKVHDSSSEVQRTAEAAIKRLTALQP